MTDAVFFKSADAWRCWLERNHASGSEIQVGLVKKGSGLVGIDYRQALDEALCFGWIDGVRNSIDDKRWMIRFTPRKRGSNWSDVNLRRVEELREAGRMATPGLEALERRDPKKVSSYSFENREAALSEAEEAAFRQNGVAWEWFAARPKSYRQPAIFWVVSAKRDETRARRLATLIEDSAAGRKVKPLRRPSEERETKA